METEEEPKDFNEKAASAERMNFNHTIRNVKSLPFQKLESLFAISKSGKDLPYQNCKNTNK